MIYKTYCPLTPLESISLKVASSTPSTASATIGGLPESLCSFTFGPDRGAGELPARFKDLWRQREIRAASSLESLSMA